jgi:hypothetical protein
MCSAIGRASPFSIEFDGPEIAIVRLGWVEIELGIPRQNVGRALGVTGELSVFFDRKKDVRSGTAVEDEYGFVLG